MASVTILRVTTALIAYFWGSQRLFFEWSFNWFNSFTFRFLILIDYVSLTFWATVLWITLSVYLFRGSYMANDQFYSRFHAILIVFVIRILLLISSPRFLRRLLGWDGLGLRSYLLVIYYSNSKAYNSGIITALTNRIGDRLILLLIGFSLSDLRWRIAYLAQTSTSKSWILVLILAAFTKRAQVPFSAWLPAAMAAPTPVSSLVHSSTLVTAGVYLLIRFNHGFVDSQVLTYLSWVGLLTTLLARTSALVEVDLKKIVALSTLSQLGVIVSLLGLGLPEVRFLHLLAHAFFKALIFVATGGMIHVSRSGQDLRRIGGMSKFFRRTKRIALLANLRLIGLPFISAFFSKEIYLEIVRQGITSLGRIILFYLGIFLTLVYGVRFLSLFYRITSKLLTLNFCRDQDLEPVWSIILLMTPAVSGGLILRNFKIEAVRPLRRERPYLLILIFIMFLSLFFTKWWADLTATKNFSCAIMLITMWGLVPRIRNWATISTANPPKLIIVNDGGYQAKIIGNTVRFFISKVSLGLLNKLFRSSLIIILVWFLIYILYYLNNILLR